MMPLHDRNVGGRSAALAVRPEARAQGMAAAASWTILAYLAGDNDLEGALLEDLREMERVDARARSRSSPRSTAREARTHPTGTGLARAATT